MSTYCVYHIIHVQTPYRYIPKLFVTEVPREKSVDWDLVDEYADYGEFNTPHANHKIQQVSSQSPVSIKRAYREGDCPRVTYAELIALSEEDFNERAHEGLSIK